MKTILLDRDGTIIKEPSDQCVNKLEKIGLFSDTIEALKYLADNNFQVILITNQSGIGFGKLSLKEFDELNKVVLKMIAPSSIKVLQTYICPHEPSNMCSCRKPEPKMILDAVQKYGLNPEETFMVGDRKTDIDAGLRAGTKTIRVHATDDAGAEFVSSTLLEAVKYAVEHS